MNAINLVTYTPEAFIQESRQLKVPVPVLNELWEKLLIEHKTCWASVVSNSMSPLIKQGYQVLVEKAPPDVLRFGDIVVFRRHGNLMTHRILGQREFDWARCFLEKGDANLRSSLVPGKNIVGRVVVIRNSSKTFKTISGSGRLLQLTLACISYSSLRLLATLDHFSIHGRSLASNHRFIMFYDRSFSLLRRIVLRLVL